MVIARFWSAAVAKFGDLQGIGFLQSPDFWEKSQCLAASEMTDRL